MPDNVPSKTSDKTVLLARVLRPAGLKGAVWLESFTAPPLGLLQYKDLYLCNGAPLRLTALVPQSGRRCRAQFAGITERSHAARLARQDIFVPRMSLPAVAKDDWYHADLLGLTVQSADGQVIGKIVAVQNFGAGDLLEIAPRTGAQFFLPFHSDYVGEIDLAQTCLVAHNWREFLPDSPTR